MFRQAYLGLLHIKGKEIAVWENIEDWCFGFDFIDNQTDELIFGQVCEWKEANLAFIDGLNSLFVELGISE